MIKTLLWESTYRAIVPNTQEAIYFIYYRKSKSNR